MSKKAIGGLVALVVVLAGVLVVMGLSTSNDRAFCATMRRTLGTDAQRLNAAVAQSAAASSSGPTPAELQVVHSLQYDLNQALHESPPEAIDRFLLDYQIRLNLAISVLQLTNAEERFHAFAVAPVTLACPGLFKSLATP